MLAPTRAIDRGHALAHLRPRRIDNQIPLTTTLWAMLRRGRDIPHQPRCVRLQLPTLRMPRTTWAAGTDTPAELPT
jgi:hypothetical protein